MASAPHVLVLPAPLASVWSDMYHKGEVPRLHGIVYFIAVPLVNACGGWEGVGVDVSCTGQARYMLCSRVPSS